ncbi:MAG: response regulator transcription factor [Lachnospiraceae bacterium]|nr:response regulator transcription factor [Lachnospiraceae bacterium]
MQEIWIVEDDVNINVLLLEALSKAGYTCRQVFSGTEAILLMENGQLDNCGVILLDLMLPGKSGEEVLFQIRKKGNTPVIVLTAKGELEDKVGLLSKGADDYITKPFEIKEVVVRVQVQLRRMNENEERDILSHKEMQLDRRNFEVKIGEEVLPKITKQEFFILELLLKHPKQAFSKEEIFEYAWKEIYMGETKTLDVHISNIRKKIKAITQEEYIETIWGIGYRLHN